MKFLSFFVTYFLIASTAVAYPPKPQQKYFRLKIGDDADPLVAGRFLSHSLPVERDRLRLGFSYNKSWLPFIAELKRTDQNSGVVLMQNRPPKTNKLYLRRTFAEKEPAYITRVGDPNDDPDPADAANLVNGFAFVRGSLLGYEVDDGWTDGTSPTGTFKTRWTLCPVPGEASSWELYFGSAQAPGSKCLKSFKLIREYVKVK